MAYLVLLVVMGAWAFFAWRGHRWMEYGSLFFACVVIAIPAEVATLRLLNVYEWRMRLLADREADKLLTSMIIACLNPLLGLLYARYCSTRPVLKALFASAMLGFIEIVLVKTGYMAYHCWSPVLTAGLFFTYFLVVRQISLIRTRMPVWVHLLGFVMWVSLLVDIPLQGIWWLWHFNIRLFGEIVRDNRLFSWVPNYLFFAPGALVVSLARGRSQLLLAVLVIASLLLMEAAAVAAGFLVHNRWSLSWSAVKYAGIIAISVGYTRWVRP